VIRHGIAALGLGSLLLAAMIVTTSACASRSSTPPRSSDDYYPHADKRKDEILVLWKQIREWRVEELGLRASPHRTNLSAVYRSSVGRLRVCPKQPKPKTPKCTDVCHIKDAICDNAESICRIADELPSDDWARDKCTSAKASCKEARQRCCSCIGKEPQPTGEGGGMVPQLPTPF
jgi:hypothetical protein